MAQTDPVAAAHTRAVQLYRAGKYAQAIHYAKKAMRLARKRLGAKHHTYANTLNFLAIVYDAQGQHKEAEHLYKRALAIYEKALGSGHQRAAQSQYNLAILYRKQARYAEAERLFKRSLMIYMRVFGPDHPYVTDNLNNLANLYQTQGRYAEAEPLYKRSLAIREKTLGPNHLKVASSLHNLAMTFRALGRYVEAASSYKRSLTIREKTLGSVHPHVAQSLNNLANVFMAQGRYGEAEPLHKRSLAIREKSLGPTHSDVAQSLNNLANLYKALGRHAEVEPLYKRALEIDEKALGPQHPVLSDGLNNLANLYQFQGRHAEAERLHKRSLTISEKALGPDHSNVADSLYNLARLYHTQGRHTEAEPVYKRSLEISRKALGPDHPNVAQSLNSLASLYDTQGRDTEAASLYERSLAIRREMLGPNHPDVAQSLSNLALLDWKLGRWAGAYQKFHTAAVVHKARLIGGMQQPRRGSDAPTDWKARVFHNLANAAWLINREEPSRKRELTGAAFEAAQWALSTSTSAALAQMAARFGSGKTKLAQLIRERQDTATLRNDLDRKLIEAIGVFAGRRDETLITSIRASIADTNKRMASLNTKLEKQYPEFAEISNPKPLTIDQTSKLLKPQEVILMFLVGDHDTFIWAISREGQLWGRAELGAKAIGEKVAALRRGLDFDAGTNSDNRGFERMVAEGPSFDLGLAHELYQALLAPVESLLRGKKHLLIVPSGALTSLPFHVLTTDKPDAARPDFASYRKATWLAKRHALTVLPSVSSLRALRVFAKKSRAKKPFIGFGDPIFRRGRAGAAKRKPVKPVSSQKRGYSAYFRGDLANISILSDELAPLPDTADELRAIARLLGVPRSEIRLREKATETAVKRAPLNRYQIVHFATHGLIAGETEKVGGRAEPSLALTLPKRATKLDDGLLIASEVAQLKLNADWVILSACNTAAAAKPGAGALSGLTRAFFYAGARALLVSHWPVVSDAAVKLTTGTFAEMKANREIGRAEALRRSMLALMNDTSNPVNAHPAVWAPFIVVGEGSRDPG